MTEDSTQAQEAVVKAVLYAMRCGCLFPVRVPRRGASVHALVRWGAMRHLHDVVAELKREK
jgi:hypothetical protein